MRYVSVTEAQQRLSALLDAAQLEPVVIRRQNRDLAILLSPEEYNRMHAFNVAEFQRFCDRVGKEAADRGLTEDTLAEIPADDAQAADRR